jgi:hypothetical protein
MTEQLRPVHRIEHPTTTLRAVTPDPAEPCGAPANGGLCIETRGHNMGRADVPDNHRAATPDPAEPGLDVERLAEAMCKVDGTTLARERRMPKRLKVDFDGMAARIAREYAALSDTTEGQS